jgi:hypothetical protein
MPPRDPVLSFQDKAKFQFPNCTYCLHSEIVTLVMNINNISEKRECLELSCCDQYVTLLICCESRDCEWEALENIARHQSLFTFCVKTLLQICAT